MYLFIRTIIHWQGSVYVDRTLPFGLQLVPILFPAIVDVMAWSLFQHGVHTQLHYLDDFLFFGSPHMLEASCTKTLALRTF